MTRVKVLMCPCYAEKFHQENHDYIKKIYHSHCRCEECGQFLYVCSCKQHPFIASRDDRMEQHCTCSITGKNEICNFCVEVKYLLIFRTFKFCTNKVPENFQEHIVSLPDYLDAIFPCTLFFKYSPTGRKVNIFLDNPKELCMAGAKKTD